MTISLHARVHSLLSGEHLMDWPMTGCQWDVIVYALHFAVASRLNIPLLCLTLTWPIPGAAPPPGTHHVVLQWSMVIPQQNPYTDRETDQCFVCGDPAEDVDLPMATRSREDNCYRCNPRSLCDGCRIMQPNAKPICLACLSDRDIAAKALTSRERRRYDALQRWWAEFDSD